jgi:hypothetical protein
MTIRTIGRRATLPGRLALAGLLFPAAASLAVPPLSPLRFDSPTVLNLSQARDWKLPSGPEMTPGKLPTDTAKAILEAKPVPDDAPGRLQNDGAGAALQGEKALLAREGIAVSRQGKELILTPKSGPAALFRDFQKPETKNTEGDSARHAYAGRIGQGALHRILVDFGHDAPGSFLVSAETGKAAFVHDAGDVVVLSRGGERLVLFNDLNAPITFVVGGLPASGAAPEVVCRLGEKGRGTIALKGWRGADSVDLVLGMGKSDQELIPLRLEKGPAGWQLLVPDPRRMALPDAVRCYTGKPGS